MNVGSPEHTKPEETVTYQYRGSKEWYYHPASEIGSELKEMEEGLDRKLINSLGVDIFTDSPVLLEQIDWLNNVSPKLEEPHETLGRIYYLTEEDNNPMIPNPRGGLGLKRMSGEPADVLYDPDTGIAVIRAWDRFTSLMGLALGVYSERRAGEGFFGMHAAFLAKEDRGVLIVGPPRSGKTTTSLILSGRGYELISDDWVEVSKARGEFLAKPAVPVVSIGSVCLRKLGEEGGVDIPKAVEESGISSYGKAILPITKFNDRWSQRVAKRVNGVMVFDNEGLISEVTPQALLEFYKRTNPHIPFFNAPRGAEIRSVKTASSSRTAEVVDSKKATEAFLEKLSLSLIPKVKVIHNKDLGIEETLKLVEGALVE